MLISALCLQDEDTPGQFCSPENPISDCHTRRLPTIVYPFTEGSNPRKARSFGTLSLAVIEQRRSRAGGLSTNASTDGGFGAQSSDGAASDSDSAASLMVGSGEDPETSPSTSDGVQASLAEKVLVREWDRRFEQGLFRYDVRECQTKVRTRSGLFAAVVL